MQITIKEANAVIGSLDSAYNGIILKGYYLPKRSSSIITTEYLFKVMTNKLYRIKLSDVRIGQQFQKANSKVLSESLLLLDVGKPWGFDQDHYPDKVWMINVLYTLNSNHQLFKNSIHECQSILTQEDLKMIQTFNTSFARQSQGRFFKRSKTQSSQYKQQISSTNQKKVLHFFVVGKLDGSLQIVLNFNSLLLELKKNSLHIKITTYSSSIILGHLMLNNF